MFVLRASRFLAVALMLSGCSVINSYDASNFQGARSSGQSSGSYYLPKHVLKLTVQRQGGAKTLAVVSEIVPDRMVPLDLGMDLSPLADDDVKVAISDKGLLTKITSINDDKTTEVVQALTRSVVSLLRDNTAGAPIPITIGRHVFDPFNPSEMTEANLWLANHGYCMDIDGVEGRCGRAKITNTTYTASVPDSYPSLTNTKNTEREPGVYYRRPQSHRVLIYRRARDRFSLFESQMIEFANLAPILRLDVQRTAFVKRQTTLTFNGGIPTEVHIVKPAEAVGLASLPLKVVEAANEAVLGSIGRNVSLIKERKKEVEAATDLMNARATYVEAAAKALKNGQPLPAGHDLGAATGVERSGTAVIAGGSAMPRDGLTGEPSGEGTRRAFMAYCLDIGMDAPSCNREWAQYYQ